MSVLSKPSLKTAIRMLSGAALFAAAIAVAPAADAAGPGPGPGGGAATGGGVSASDGAWQQLLDRNHAMFPNTQTVYRPIYNPVVPTPHVPR